MASVTYHGEKILYGDWSDPMGFWYVGQYSGQDGYVKVKLGGACETCAMSTMTLKQGIERKLMEEIPDVVGVVQVL